MDRSRMKRNVIGLHRSNAAPVFASAQPVCRLSIASQNGCTGSATGRSLSGFDIISMGDNIDALAGGCAAAVADFGPNMVFAQTPATAAANNTANTTASLVVVDT